MPRSGAAICSALSGPLGQSERQGQEAHRSEGGVDNHADPGAAPPLDNVGQDQRDRHKGHQDLPREGGVEQQPQESIHQPGPPPKATSCRGSTTPRQANSSPTMLSTKNGSHAPRTRYRPGPSGSKAMSEGWRSVSPCSPPSAAPRPPVST